MLRTSLTSLRRTSRCDHAGADAKEQEQEQEQEQVKVQVKVQVQVQVQSTRYKGAGAGAEVVQRCRAGLAEEVKVLIWSMELLLRMRSRKLSRC